MHSPLPGSKQAFDSSTGEYFMNYMTVEPLYIHLVVKAMTDSLIQTTNMWGSLRATT